MTFPGTGSIENDNSVTVEVHDNVKESPSKSSNQDFKTVRDTDLPTT